MLKYTDRGLEKERIYFHGRTADSRIRSPRLNRRSIAQGTGKRPRQRHYARGLFAESSSDHLTAGATPGNGEAVGAFTLLLVKLRRSRVHQNGF